MKNRIWLLFVLTSFWTDSFAGSGLYLEFKMTSKTFNGSTKTWTLDGNTRSETYLTMASSGSPIISATLFLKDQPEKLYMLSDKDKTYSVMDVNRNARTDNDEYDVTVVGKEKVDDYKCTHATITNRRTQHTTDMWVSTGIAGYADFTVIKNRYLEGSNLFKALKDKGAEGFVVRMVVHGDRGDEIQMDLVKAEKQQIDASRFSLNGYSKVDRVSPAPTMDMQRLQQMTPEERKKYIDEMRQKYQPQPH